MIVELKEKTQIDSISDDIAGAELTAEMLLTGYERELETLRDLEGSGRFVDQEVLSKHEALIEHLQELQERIHAVEYSLQDLREFCNS